MEPSSASLAKKELLKKDSLLTAKRVREALHYDPLTGEFIWLIRNSMRCPIGSVAGCVSLSTGYVVIGLDGRHHRAHRLAWLWTHGEWPSAVIDHRNGCKTDNRLENLRACSLSVNSRNQSKAHKGSTTGFLGVGLEGGIYVARIRVDGRLIRLGRFSTGEAAHAAYLAAKQVHHAA